MRGKFKDAIEDEGPTLEEDITPVPTVIFDDVMSFCFYPDVENDQEHATNQSDKNLDDTCIHEI